MKIAANRFEATKNHVKKRGNSGFSLTELLTVIVIMTLVGMVVATSIPAAHRAYIAATDASNAQVLLSTTTTRLREVLSVADPNTIVDGDEDEGTRDKTLTTFESHETGLTTAITTTLQGLCISEANGHLAGAADSPNPLVPSSAAKGLGDSDLCSFARQIVYNKSDGVFEISGLKVCRVGDVDQVLADARGVVKVRVIAAQ